MLIRPCGLWTNMETLDEIGRRFQTDQSSLFHGYLRTMGCYFAPYRDKVITFLEIGLAGGSSLRTWKAYFPNSEILGMDHSPNTIGDLLKTGIGSQYTLFLADSSTEEGWQLLKGAKIDICSDDASHNVWASYRAFILGWPLIVPGGLWIISDTHAGWDKAFRRDNKPNGLPDHWTANDVIADLSRRRLHEFGDSQCGRFTTVESDIEFVHYYKSLIVIKKRLTKGAEDAQ